MSVRTGEGQHTSYDEFFARLPVFVYVAGDKKPDLGTIVEGGREKPVVRVEVSHVGGNLVEICHLDDGGTRGGRRRLMFCT